jgi:phospholipid/cholesterol/gamma-HCH transport system permease protein
LNDPAPALLSTTRTGDTLSVSLRGEWHIATTPPDFTNFLAASFSGSTPPSKITFDASTLGKYDSSLISLLLKLHKQCDLTSTAFDRDSLPSGVNDLLDMALAVPETEDARAGVSDRHFFFRLGTASLQLVDGLFDLFSFLGECLFSIGRLFTGRARFRHRDFWVTVQECGAEALPIVSLISCLIGMILAFVGAHQLASMGATLFVADLVAIAMVREMGVIMTGIIMSGRTGAAFAAQLGSMKVNEEIDALRTFGFNPIDFLVLPRILALVIMMPLLTVYANIVGIVGGMIVGVFMGLSFEQYFNQTVNSLDLVACSIGLVKSVVFGVIIAGAGCLRGMQSGTSSSAVGTAATSAVVTSITAIILADAIFAIVTTIMGL